MRPRKPAALAALAVMIVAFSGVSLLGVSGVSSAYTPVEISLELPSFAATLQAIPCTLEISGGPAELGANFTYKAEIIAGNTTGSSVSPSTGSAASGVFNLTITMPGEAQDIKVKINATSRTPNSSEYVSKVKEFEIKVVAPIVITATVYNTGHVDAENVTAKFYADGIVLGEQKFAVAAGQSKELVHNWTWANIADGKHVVTVIIDDADGIVEFSDGNNVYSMTIYVGSQGNPVGGVLTVGVIIMSVLVTLMILAKPGKRK